MEFMPMFLAFLAGFISACIHDWVAPGSPDWVRYLMSIVSAIWVIGIYNHYWG